MTGVQTCALPIYGNKLRQVIANLIGNASEAMVGQGRDPSKFTTPQPAISVSTRHGQRGVEITVADNGPGIPENIRDKVTEPLFTTKSFGTGLGLPAVEKILQEHGGGLEIGTASAPGAVFVAWLPRIGAREEVA